MRESKKTERMHLPRGSTEEWLESQTPTYTEVMHRNPPRDSFEAWIEKRVEESRKGKKTAPKESA